MHSSARKTKAESLEYLKKYEKKFGFKIPLFFYFSKKEFQKNPDKFIYKIKNFFGKKKIILRSSATNEDRINESNAGKFKSFENILPDNKIKIKINIDKIIKDFKNLSDQVIVQEFISKTNISGVIFTRSFLNNSPYYIINFDRSGKTNLITSGKNNPSMKTIIIYKNKLNINKFWEKYLQIITNLEIKMQNDRLDIEFCIKNNSFFLLQCRPLKKFKSKLNNDNLISTGLKNIEKKIIKLKRPIHNLIGKTNCFSNMSDWNPAEMIGVKPSSLAMSLYSELITDEVWAQQRVDYGYKDVRPNPLMINFAGSAYIDLRVDFNSFLPNNLPIKIQEKAINHYFDKIRKKPQLQDKIEFDVVETCYDFKSKEKLKGFLKDNEVGIYLKCLRSQLNNIIKDNGAILDKEKKKIDFLDKKINVINNDKISEIQKIYFHLKYCKSHGTLPFAGIARCAFIATKLMRSMLEMKIIDDSNYKSFYESIKTITKEICYDSQFIKKNNNNRDKFLKKFGHLRPSMYDITSKNYNENLKNYFSSDKNLEIRKTKKLNLNSIKLKKIDKLFKKHNLKISAKAFFKFAKDSIELREYSKMVFAKSINEIFNNLIKISKKIDIDRNDLEFISIKTILNLYNNLDIEQIRKSLKIEISKNKKYKKITDLIEFPELINSYKDLYSQELKSNLANYVTDKNISGELIDFEKVKNFKQLKNKIILLKNADPGYDFIFSHNVKGLITEYGGANSHMSIRCLELGKPAIIGLGTKNFNLIKKSNYIQINANQKYFKIIR